MDELDGKCFSLCKNTPSGEEDEDTYRMAEANNNVPDIVDGRAFVTTSRYADYYKMNHKRRGMGLIFNHKNFRSQKPRIGTEIDVARLKNCFGYNLGFEIQVFDDLHLDEIKQQVKLAASADHSDVDCIFIAILTHGGEDTLLCSESNSYNPKHVFFDQFTADMCPTLAGKPKIFLLVACRGENTDPGIQLYNRTEFDGLVGYRIATKADFLYIYSTSHGDFHFRNQKTGSYFIRILCEELQNSADKEHLTDILTRVNNRVSVDFRSTSLEKELHDQHQMPRFESSLTKKVHFNYPDVKQTEETFYFQE